MAGSANQQDINNQKELNKDLKEGAKSLGQAEENAAALAERMRDALFFTRDYADEAKKAAKEVYGSTIAASETAKAFRDVASAAKKITDNYAGVLTGEKKFKDLQKEILALNKSKISLATEQKQLLTSMRVSEEDIKKVLSGNLNIYKEFSERGYDIKSDQMVLLDLYQNQNQQLTDEAANMAEIAKTAGDIEDAMSPLGSGAIGLQDLAEGLEEGLGKAGLGSLAGKLGISEAIEETRILAAEQVKANKGPATFAQKMELAGKFTGKLAGNLMKSLGPIALIAKSVEKVVEAYKLIDGLSGEVAKSMGISAAEGNKLVISATKFANASGDGLLTTKDIVNAQMSLNKEFASSVNFSEEFAANFAHIQERTGLSSEAMGRFASLALLAGTNVQDQLAEVTAVSMEMQAQTGMSLNVKDLQEDIGKLSASQVLSAGRNTRELSEQVVQSRLLGLSSSQLEATASKLLDFESSIGAEMEAELLTGKSLNLEAARYAALMGKNGDLAKELSKQVGTSAEFGEMNVIQQEALAAAFGLGRNEMAQMLIDEEELQKIRSGGFKSLSDAQKQYNEALEKGNLTEELKTKLQEAGLLNQLQSATQSDKMVAAGEKLTDVFVALADPIMKVVSPIIDLLVPALMAISFILTPISTMFEGMSKILTGSFDTLTGWEAVLGGIAVIYGTIVGYQKLMALLDLKSLALGKSKNIQLATEAALTALKNPLVAIAGIAAAAAVGAAAYSYIKGNDVMSPGGNTPGYGGRTLMGPEGAIALNNKDTVIAGTDLFPGGGNNSSTDNSEVVGLLKTLISAVNQGGDVFLDGTKVGYTLALQSSKMG